MDTFPIIYRGVMFALCIANLVLGYTCIAYPELHWQRHAKMLQTRGHKPTRTPAWDNRIILQGTLCLLIGFACIALTIFIPNF